MLAAWRAERWPPHGVADRRLDTHRRRGAAPGQRTAGRDLRCSEALTALGHRAGYDGHPLVEVADWVALLAPLAPRRLRPAVRAHRSAYLLADAWAAGRLAQPPSDQEERIDHLELRLGELYDRCAALGLTVDREVALAVVAIHGLPGRRRGTARWCSSRRPRRPGASSPPASRWWCSAAAGCWCWPSAADPPLPHRSPGPGHHGVDLGRRRARSGTGSNRSRRTAPPRRPPPPLAA